MKNPKSKRNRHTGHINAFKALVIKRGDNFIANGHKYHRAFVGGATNDQGRHIGGGYSVVRTN